MDSSSDWSKEDAAGKQEYFISLEDISFADLPRHIKAKFLRFVFMVACQTIKEGICKLILSCTLAAIQS
jgi:hypothetical protein